MSLYISNNFEILNEYFSEALFLLNNANKDLVWEGKARENFDKQTEILKNTFHELLNENQTLNSEYMNLVNNAHTILFR